MKRFMLTSLAVVILSFNQGCAHKPVASAQAQVKPAGTAVSALTMAKDEGVIDKSFFNKVVAEKAANVSLVDVRTNFEFAAGNFSGSKLVPINEIYSEGCPATIAKLPKEGFVVFVCATGARAGEMYFGLKDDCKMDMKRFAYLDAEVAFGPKGPVVK
jgi:hydroxyacylglutathione hydrolase